MAKRRGRPPGAKNKAKSVRTTVNDGDGRLSSKELGAVLGVLPSKIRDGVHTGRLTPASYIRGADKRRAYRFDEAVAVREWRTNVQTNKINPSKLAANPALTPPASYFKRPSTTDQTDEDEEPEDRRTLSVVELTRRTKLVDLEKKEVELAVLRGTLVEKDAVYVALFGYGARVKQSIQAVPKRSIDDILAAPSRAEAVKILTETLNDALRVIADAERVQIN